MKINYSIFERLLISFILIILPTVFLLKGIYGSFLFTFSIPIIWQIGLRGERFSSLGLSLGCFVKSSIVTGIITGLILGFIGGFGLRIIGLSGKVFTATDKLEFSFANLLISFPLQKEVGYQLLSISNIMLSTCLFFIFCIVAIGLGEEIFWRGFIQKKISSCLPINASVIITSILFSLIHFYIFTIVSFRAGILFLVLIAFAGYVWGYLAKRFGNIWSAAISHGITAFIIWKYFFFAH